MDPFTAACNLLTALANLEIARLSAMTQPQREKYLQMGIDTGESVQKGWQDFATRVIDVFHPATKAA